MFQQKINLLKNTIITSDRFYIALYLCYIHQHICSTKNMVTSGNRTFLIIKYEESPEGLEC